MSIFSATSFYDHQQVHFFNDSELGLRAIVAIHNMNLGPALGGCRLWDYASEEDALTDVLRLSRGMTYKAALAGMPLGGGKMVVLGPIKKTPAVLKRIGEFVDSLGGQYITAEDVGISVDDIEHIHAGTNHVVGLPDGNGNPSPFTARGVYRSLCAAVRHRLGKDSIAGLTIAVQGLGSVGFLLSKHLHEAGANLIVYDINPAAVERACAEFGAKSVDEISMLSADVYAPCALGGTLNDETIPLLKAKVVCGAANNQLAHPRHGNLLQERGILYAPDYVVNAGGLICVWLERQKKSIADLHAHIDGIETVLSKIFQQAEKKNISTSAAADQLAEEKYMGTKKGLQ